MTPKQLYEQFIQEGKYTPDPQQLLAIDELERIYQELQKNWQSPWLSLELSRLLTWEKKHVKGLYLWGSVGIGKTWLMDIFFHCLPDNNKMRYHFHAFMRQIQRDLTRLQGIANPLKEIARKIRQQTQVLCFDEFFVLDITDAMILAKLLQALFDEGITLVATSNTEPDELYKNGLQREQFLPAIELIKQNTEVLHLLSHQDYRLRSLVDEGVYYHPLNEEAQLKMRTRFEELAGSHWQDHEIIIIEGRGIPTVRNARGIAWFNFSELCNIPRSQLDYLEIAHVYHTVLLSNVPKILPNQDNLINYLINLIDIFYDTKVKLITSAATPITDIYTEGKMLAPFQRTQSRLIEMQSLYYLQQPHMI